MNNLRLKLFSLSLAIAFSYIVNYFFVQNDTRVSVLQLIVPVEIKNLPPERIVVFPLTRQVEVTLQGPPLWLSRVASTPPYFRVSIPADAPNRFSAPLRKADLNLPPYVDILSIKPPEIELTLDNRIKKIIPVNVPRIGSLADTLRLDSIKVKPDKVEIFGPETELRSIQALETNPIDLREVHGPMSTELELRSPGTLSESQVKKVTVDIAITSLMVEKTYENQMVEVRAMPGTTYMVEPSSVNVRLSGAKEVLNALTTEEVIPYVRVQKGAQSEKNQKVALDVPKGVAIVAIEPGTVDLTLMPAPVVNHPKAGTSSMKKGKP